MLSVGYGLFTLDTHNDLLLYAHLDQDDLKLHPFYFKYEHALNAYLSIGINLMYLNYEDTYTVCGDCPVPLTPSPPPNTVPYYYRETATYSSFNVLARLNWHWLVNKKIDSYLGLGLGYEYGQWAFTDHDPLDERGTVYSHNYPFGLEITEGIRYYFIDHLSIYAEVGLAKSFLQTGLTAKF